MKNKDISKVILFGAGAYGRQAFDKLKAGMLCGQ